MTKLRAAHPGKILSDEFIKPLGLSVSSVARAAGISLSSLSQITNAGRGIDTETAVRLSFYFGTSAEFWLNLQRDFDLRQIRRDRAKAIKKEVQPLAV